MFAASGIFKRCDFQGLSESRDVSICASCILGSGRVIRRLKAEDKSAGLKLGQLLRASDIFHPSFLSRSLRDTATPNGSAQRQCRSVLSQSCLQPCHVPPVASPSDYPWTNAVGKGTQAIRLGSEAPTSDSRGHPSGQQHNGFRYLIQPTNLCKTSTLPK